MDSPQENNKVVYVALGNEREEGFKTLKWTLQRWRFHPLSIIILHINITKDIVDTYFGKMHANYISEEMLELIRKKEQENIDKLLSQYITFCGKVKAEVFKVEKYDKPIRELIIDLISGLHINNLVMGLTFMKSSSRKAKTAISGCFYIYQQKPEFCDEFFIVSGGKQISMSEENFGDSIPLDSPRSQSQWECYTQEIDNYFQHLLSLNLDEEVVINNCHEPVNNDNSPIEAEMRKLQTSNMSIAEKSQCLRTKTREILEMIQSKRDETKANSRRHAKAERVIYLCNERMTELKNLMTKVGTNPAILKEELDNTKELLNESILEVEESKRNLKSLVMLRYDLSNKLQSLEMAKSQGELELQRLIVEREEMVPGIDALRRERDVFQRRIKFYNKEEEENYKEIGEIIRCRLREFSGEEIRLATEDFSERLRIKSGGDLLSGVYKCRINLQTVAIKMFTSSSPNNAIAHQDFQLKVKFLGKIRHPHLLGMMGFCLEPKCIVFEYMHNGSLKDTIFSSSSCGAIRALSWHTRIHVAAQICSGLSYLHLAKPIPIVHSQLTISNIFLDRNLVAKIGGFGLSQAHHESHVVSDVQAFGLLLIQLLTGRNWAGLVDDAMLVDKAALVQVLDETGGAWPLDIVERLALLAFRCLGPTKLKVEVVMEELEELKKKCVELVDRRRGEISSTDGGEGHESCEIPLLFRVLSVSDDIKESQRSRQRMKEVSKDDESRRKYDARRGTEKVYVALGNDLEDGFKTLEWTLKKWKSQPISIIILHLTFSVSKDYVYTPFGKLPASAVSDKKLDVLRQYEKEKIDKLLPKYTSFCGQVKTELLKVEKCDEPIHKITMDLISRLKITNLVMGFSFLKSSPWKIKNAISGSFYVHKNKPDFCELFIICGGKLLSIKGENKRGIMEDDQGVMVAKFREKGSFKDWLGKIFIPPQPNSLEKNPRRLLSSLSINLDSPSSQTQWENCVEEIEEYYQHLLSLNLDHEAKDEEDVDQENENFDLQSLVMELGTAGRAAIDLSNAEKIQCLKTKLKEAKNTVQNKRIEAMGNAERRSKAERAIFLCNRRSDELQTKIKEEVKKRTELKKVLEDEEEHLHATMAEVEETKKRLKSLTQLNNELSNKLHASTLAKSQSEAQLHNAVNLRSKMVREIEELRQQRDVLQRRIEFCKEKDAIQMVARFGQPSGGCKDFTADQIRMATNGFSERMRLKPGGDWTGVYRGRIGHSLVAIKRLDSVNGMSQEDFQSKVLLLSQIRHPNLVPMVGYCSELKCIVFEYMHNGSLRDIFLRDILYSRKGSAKKRIRTLRWYDRIRIAAEICSGLGFLHMAKPKPIVHGQLRLANILLDRNLNAKITGFGLSKSGDEQWIRSDIRAFGVLLMHLLTGRNWAGLVEAMTMDRAGLIRDLDEMAGQWPMDLAERLAGLTLKCLSRNRGPNMDLKLATVMEELNDLREKARDLVSSGQFNLATRNGSDVAINRALDGEDPMEVPSFFLCPIFQDVMKNPHVAVDGFSYELEAIEEWLRMGNDTSPMTNLRLKNTFLTPNHTLRTLIQDWHNKRSIPPP
uniref:RING-type E3 ubiquitin transferase n=1 Tax=Cannabis sativa TaxID=3483 RepID=A0A803PDY2_CANSA